MAVVSNEATTTASSNLPNDTGDSTDASTGKSSASQAQSPLPSLSLPKGGGAVRGTSEKVQVNEVTGSSSITLPIALTPLPGTRGGFHPSLSLAYDSNSGNGPFGWGWSVSLPSITRKTNLGLPKYNDAEESDVFILLGFEDLVPVQVSDQNGMWAPYLPANRVLNGEPFSVKRYRPRIEETFARVEQWTSQSTGLMHWRSISNDNVTTLYGTSADSCVADPEDPSRIFSWLIDKSYDDKGNVIVYGYQKEDSQNVDTALPCERNRSDITRSAAKYLKRVKYGNQYSRLGYPDKADSAWLFEVVFDYGDHDSLAPTPGVQSPWLCRNDPFSTYKSGFEVRHYRLCQRILMFHHFPDEPDVGQNCLVASTDILYRSTRGVSSDSAQGSPLGSFVESVTQTSYLRNGATYAKASLPPMQFSYSEAIINDEYQELDAASLENLPGTLSSSGYSWLDLDAEGIPGLLTEQGNRFYYKRNLGEARFGPLEMQASKPSISSKGDNVRFTDIAGDGHLDLLDLDQTNSGYFKRTSEYDWEAFTTFKSSPAVNWKDPLVAMVDLTGDGLADVLISTAQDWLWFESLGELGFTTGELVPKGLDEEDGPLGNVPDEYSLLQFADMSGDGLHDLVRVRNGQVCYWPNLGYSKFGKKIEMGNVPPFAPDSLFHPSRIRLADVDGSGTTDIIYFGTTTVSIFLNQFGNGFGEAIQVNSFPEVDNIAEVSVVDLFGIGTSCLVWSSNLSSDSGKNVGFVDLLGGTKPHLMISIENNLGAETQISYLSSTKFYLEDKVAGKPWATRLAFPVHVVSQVSMLDHIGNNKFVSQYKYHHGYFDGPEREFRGFGLVEKIDTEILDDLDITNTTASSSNPVSHTPPSLTKTWYHTGAYLEEDSILARYQAEYFKEYLSWQSGDENSQRLNLMRLPDIQPPDTIWLSNNTKASFNLSTVEARESFRSLKGKALRKEIFALDTADQPDGTQSLGNPFSVQDFSYSIAIFQPQAANRHTVFQSRTSETVEYHYERQTYPIPSTTNAIMDPRVRHNFILETDVYGNVLQSAEIYYGRRQPDSNPQFTDADHQEQARIRASYATNSYTNVIDADDEFHTPVNFESQSYELHNLTTPTNALATNLIKHDSLKATVSSLADGKHDITYQDYSGKTATDVSSAYRRLVSHTRSYFRSNDLSTALPLGTIESMAIPYNSNQLAMKSDLAQQIYVQGSKVAAGDLDNLLSQQCGLVHSAGDNDWWTTGGLSFFAPAGTDEFTYAKQHFFIPCRYRNPFYSATFNTESLVKYDKYDLLLEEAIDCTGNRVTAGERNVDPTKDLTKRSQAYRLLMPTMVMNKNRNRTQASFDILGQLVALVVMGKPEESVGDTLASLPAADDTTIKAYFDDPVSSGVQLIAGTTSRFMYDHFAYFNTKTTTNPRPVATSTISRDVHQSDLPAGQTPRVFQTISYSNGYGNVIQTKTRVDAGPTPQRDATTGKIMLDGNGQPIMTTTNTDPRWAGSGWTIFDSKGAAIRKFEPFFTDTHRYEADSAIGVSLETFYDALGRPIGVLNPDHTWTKSVVGPWSNENWDANDTCQIDPSADAHLGPYFSRLDTARYMPTWYNARIAGALGSSEATAASKSAVHANTPSRAFVNSLGQEFLHIDQSNSKYSDDTSNTPNTEYIRSVSTKDFQGNLRETRDALNRVVISYDCDMLGNVLHQNSAESGERWKLKNVLGQDFLSWDSRDQRFRKTYDTAGRAIDVWLSTSGGAEVCTSRNVYGNDDSNQATNARGKNIKIYDQAGTIDRSSYDYEGNLLAVTRTLSSEYKSVIDWSDATKIILEPETFKTTMSYNAFGIMIDTTKPDQSRIKVTFNQANQLKSVQATIHGEINVSAAITNIEYNAKGQRIRVDDGNSVSCLTTFDFQTFRPRQVKTIRAAAKFPGDTPQPAVPTSPGSYAQNLSYTYDATGNITRIQDDAQQLIYFRGNRVEPSNNYTYDSLSKLIDASGREHLGQASTGTPNAPTPSTAFDPSQVSLDSPGNSAAMGTYLEKYAYDKINNIQTVQHLGSDPKNPGWTRTFNYVLQNGVARNRLDNIVTGSVTESFKYDGSAGKHGCMTQMAHLKLMDYNYSDLLQCTSQQIRTDGGTPEKTYYVYDSGGQRVRKVTERAADPGQTPTKLSERLYVDNLEIYRTYKGDGTTVNLERQSIHVIGSSKRVAVVETRTQGQDSAKTPARLVRYQYTNHLGSACLELDDQAQVLSYEEYTPFGSTTYQATTTDIDVPEKRIRYIGKERDSETGFYAIGARYYASWLCRWTSCDPSGPIDDFNLYVYAKNNPIVFSDTNGHQSDGMAWRDPNRPWYADEVDKAALHMQMKWETIKLIRSSPMAGVSVFFTIIFHGDDETQLRAAQMGNWFEQIGGAAAGAKDIRDTMTARATQPTTEPRPVAAEIQPAQAHTSETAPAAPAPPTESAPPAPAAPIDPSPAPAATSETPASPLATQLPSEAGPVLPPPVTAPPALLPGQGSPAGPGPTDADVLRAKSILGTRISDNADVMAVWNSVRDPNAMGDPRKIYEAHRDRFWYAVRAEAERGNTAARDFFTNASAVFPPPGKNGRIPTSAPYFPVTGRGTGGTISLDHIVELKNGGNPVDARNLRYLVSGDNTNIENLDKQANRLTRTMNGNFSANIPLVNVDQILKTWNDALQGR